MILYDSLLAKQVWRMVNNQDSLCHRVFKAWFFPDCSILEAKDSTLGSYAWKSIISARDVIREGMVWRIGNGQSIKIREDKWLPVQSNRSVISSLPSIAPETKVSSLINPELRGWNSSLVNQLFLPHEATVICGMPLSIRLPPDKIIWGLIPSGMFTTKSAYELLVSRNSTNLAGTSSAENQKLFWRSLWQLRVLNKLKHFSWRACNDALPTMTILVRRHIVTTEVCSACQAQPEDTLHALWSCTKFELVWSSFSWSLPSANAHVLSFQDLLHRYMQIKEDYRAEIFVIVA